MSFFSPLTTSGFICHLNKVSSKPAAAQNSGQSIYVVSKLLGHSQLKTTARYSHLADETLMSAVDAAAKVVDSSWRPGV